MEMGLLLSSSIVVEAQLGKFDHEELIESRKLDDRCTNMKLSYATSGYRGQWQGSYLITCIKYFSHTPNDHEYTKLIVVHLGPFFRPLR